MADYDPKDKIGVEPIRAWEYIVCAACFLAPFGGFIYLITEAF